MGRARDEAGNIWEIADDGTPIGLVAPAAAAPPPVTLSGPDPDLPVRRAKAALDLKAAAASAARAAATAPYDVRKAAADAKKAELDARKAAAATSGQAPLTSEAVGKLKAQQQGVLGLARRLKEVRQRYDKDLKGGGIGALAEYLPGALRPANSMFDDAARSMMGDMAAAQGLTAQQQNTPQEIEMRFGPLIPTAGERDERIEAKIARIQDMVTGQGESLNATLPDAQFKAELERLIAAGDRAGVEQLLTTQGQGVKDPAALDEALRKRRAVVTVTPRGNEPPAPPPPPGPQDLGAFDAGMRSLANGVLVNQGGEVAGFLDTVGQTFNQGLGGRSFRDVLGENVAANEAQLAAGRKAHPYASIGGEIAGTVGSGLGLLRGGASLLGRVAPYIMRGGKVASGARAATGEALYGGAYGAGDATGGGRAQNAAIGAVTAPIASAAGKAVLRGVSNLAAPTVQPAVQRLIDKGLVLSSAQRAAGNNTLLGATRRKIQDASTSMPVLGDAIASQRARQFEQLGRATVDEALAPIGVKAPTDKAGNELVEYANEQVSKMYDRALPGIAAPIDPAFIAANNAVRQSAQTLPDAQRQTFDTIYQRAVTPFIPQNGVLTGKALQDIKRGLDKQILRLDRTDNPADEYLADELRSLRGVFFDWAERAAPDKVDQFRAANAAFANMVRVNKATAAAKKDGVFTPLQLLGAVKANASDAQFASGGLPMQQLGQDAAQLLPSTIPESGTFPRALVNTAGVALGGGGVAALPPLAPVAGLYGGLAFRHLPYVDKALQDAAVKRGVGALRAGQQLRRFSRGGGRAVGGATLAIQGPAVE